MRFTVQTTAKRGQEKRESESDKLSSEMPFCASAKKSALP